MQNKIYFGSIYQLVDGRMGACSIICVLIMGWLHENLRSLPNQKEIDALIQHGCDEWNRLKEIQSLKKTYEDGHFDLDSIIQQELNSMIVDFMKPKNILLKPKDMIAKFSISKDKTIYKISNDISKIPRIYKVGWVEYFFILTVEENA